MKRGRLPRLGVRTSVRALLTTVFAPPSSWRAWEGLRGGALADYGWLASNRTRRSSRHGHPLPWFVYSATDWLDQVISCDATILEFGSGASTAWWLERGNQVVSLEADSQWAESVVVAARAKGHAERLRMYVKPDVPSALELLAQLGKSRVHDVIVVDGMEPRGEVLIASAALLPSDGIIVLDNSERGEYADALLEMARLGFRRLDFRGLGPINCYGWRTSAFFRAPPIIRGRRLS